MKTLIYFLFSVIIYTGCSGGATNSSLFVTEGNPNNIELAIKYTPRINQFLNDKKKSRKSSNIWGEILKYSVTGFGLVSAAILSSNTSDSHTDSKNTVGIISAALTVGTGIFLIAINPSQEDDSIISDGDQKMAMWVTSRDSDDLSLKQKAADSLLIFAYKNGIIIDEE